MTLLTAYQTLLCRYSGEEDIAVGTPVAGRNQREFEELIGCFVNMLVLRGSLSGQPTFRQMLKRTREMTLSAYAHQDVPFEKIVEALQADRDLSRSPLFQVVLAMHNLPIQQMSLPGLQLGWETLETDAAKFDLMMSFMEGQERLQGSVQYSSDLFNRSRIERMITHFERILTVVAEDPDLPLAQVQFLDEAERRQTVIERNATGREIPSRCIHELFEQQAESLPANVAIECCGEQLSYSELNGRSNQLANFLKTLGAGPEMPIGICLERSVDLVIGILAILKAGGA